MSDETRITEKALCMAITFRKWGIRRKIKITPDAETNADKRLLRVTKKIVDAPEYKAVCAIDGEIKDVLRRRAVAFPLQKSVWMVPIAALAEIDAEIEQKMERRVAAVAALDEAMPRIKNESEARLNDLFVASEYPTGERLRSCFSVEKAYVSFDVPGALGQIDESLFDSERRKAETRWGEAAEEIQAALRESFAELVAAMVEQLTPGEDGKRRKFYDSRVESLREFIDNFRTRNLTDDSALESLCAQARAIVDGADPNDLKKNETVRTTVKDALACVSAKLDEMICAAPSRRFAFDDEQ